MVASAHSSCALVCSVVLGSYILCPGLNHLFPFDCQEQTQIFRLCWSFPAPYLQLRSQEGACATLLGSAPEFTDLGVRLLSLNEDSFY